MVTSLITQRNQNTLNYSQTPSLGKVMMRGSVGLVPPLLQLHGAGGTARENVFTLFQLSRRRRSPLAAFDEIKSTSPNTSMPILCTHVQAVRVRSMPDILSARADLTFCPFLLSSFRRFSEQQSHSRHLSPPTISSITYVS